MGYSVEGPWKNFVIKLIEKEDIPKVQEFLREEFIRFERTCELGGFSEETDKDFERLYDWIFSLDEKLSFIAVDSRNGKIASARITYIQTKDMDFARFNFTGKAMTQLLEVIRMVDKEAKVFEHYGIDHYAMFITAATAREYQHQGLATEMYKRSFPLLRERKLPMVKSIFTSPYSRKCAQNFNFEELSKVHYKGLRDSNGKIMFPESTDNDYASLMCLKL